MQDHIWAAPNGKLTGIDDLLVCGVKQVSILVNNCRFHLIYHQFFVSPQVQAISIKEDISDRILNQVEVVSGSQGQ